MISERDDFLDTIADTLSEAGKLVILLGVFGVMVFWPWVM
jgi:hypothetical protein